jgi:hypothetical protein
MANRCWCLDSAVEIIIHLDIHQVSWKFTVLSFVNPASSVNRRLATDCVFTTQFAIWKTPPLHDGQETWGRALTRCGRGNDCSQRIFQTRGTLIISSAAAILHTLGPGSSSTLLNMPTSQKLVHISLSIDFWTYIAWDFFAHLSESYTPFMPVTLFSPFFFLTLCIWRGVSYISLKQNRACIGMKIIIWTKFAKFWMWDYYSSDYKSTIFWWCVLAACFLLVSW